MSFIAFLASAVSNRKLHLERIPARMHFQDAAAGAGRLLFSVAPPISPPTSRGDLVATLRGVGRLAAAVLLADMPELGTMEARQAPSLAASLRSPPIARRGTAIDPRRPFAAPGR